MTVEHCSVFKYCLLKMKWDIQVQEQEDLWSNKLFGSVWEFPLCYKCSYYSQPSK